MGEPSTRFGRWAARVGEQPLPSRQKIAIVVVLIAASVLITATTFTRDASDAASESRLLNEGSRSHARIENVFNPLRGDFAQVTLLILDGDAEGWSVRVSLEKGTSLQQGEEVSVAYDPKDPGDLVVVGEDAAPNNGLAVGAWIFTAVVAIAFVRRSRSGRPDPQLIEPPDSDPTA